MTDPTQPPPEFPKGHRPQVFSDPAIDQLYDGYVILGTELAVAFDRIDTLERLLQERLGMSRAEIDAYKPNEVVEAERQARRADLAQRLLRPFREFRDDRITRGSRRR
ncbi:MAG: hypothetical protein KJS73_03265 [Gammaproteobacteria bacterium]|jgi:hypothetical protein|nr:hypothetical protein [Gammaproteobacteria bacterium]